MNKELPDWLDSNELESFLSSQIKIEGLLKKKVLERLQEYKVIQRGFRRITVHFTKLNDDTSREGYSLIDEQFATLVQDNNQRLLLWRPNYAKINLKDFDKQSTNNDTQLQSAVDDILELRWNSQVFDDEMQPKLKRIQADPLFTISFILPRVPGSLRRENILINERKESHAFILATSLVTNTTQKDIITSADIGRRLIVPTVVATYRDMNGRDRILSLEFPIECSIDDALKNGKALTRLCELNEECRGIISMI